MKIKLFLSKFLLVIATATLFAAPLAAEISVANFRGLASVLKPEHEYLSPIHGALLWKNNYIENLYRYGDQTSETVKLIKEMFFVQPDGVTFGPTSAPNNIATYFEPQHVGVIVRQIIDFKRSEQTQTEELRTSLRTFINNIKPSEHKSSKRRLVKAMCSAIAEENNLYVENNTLHILLAFLFKKCDSKESYIEYFKAFDSDVFNNPSFLEDESLKQEFLQGQYTIENYVTLTTTNPTEITDNRFELLTLSILGFYEFKNTLPEPVCMASSVNYNGLTFADCGSTSLRNFFNALLYDPTTSTFNVQILKDMNAKDTLIDFYENKYPNTEKFQTKQANDDWAQVTSELPGVKYRTGEKCEIDSGIKNMLKVLEGLVGTKSFEDFKEKFNTAAIDFCEIGFIDPQKDIEANDTGNSINFHISKNESDSKITWRFDSGHFEIEFPSTTKIQHARSYIQNLLANIDNQSDYEKIKRFLILSSYSASIPEIQSQSHEITSLNESFLLFNRNYKRPVESFKIIKQIAQNKILMSDEHAIFKINFIRKLYSTLPVDHYWQKKFFRTIFESSLNIFDPANRTFQDLDDLQKTTAIELILSKNKESHTQWAAETIRTIENNRETPELIKTIINKEFTPEQAVFAKELYQWVAVAIKTIEDDKKIQLIETIINKEFTPEQNESTQILYLGIIEATQRIEDDWPKTRLIKIILNKEFTPEQATLANKLYQCAVEAIKTINDSHYKADLIETILNKKFTREQATFAEALHRWATEAIATINNDRRKAYLIKTIIAKEFTPEQATFAQGLYQGAAEAIKTIEGSSGEKIDLVKTILEKEFTPEQATFSQELYQWTAGAIETFSDGFGDYNKIRFIKTIMNKEFTTEQTESIQILYRGAAEAIRTIEESKYSSDILGKTHFIKEIINEDFARKPESVPFLYREVAEAIKTMEDDDNKVNLITTIINKKFTPEQTESVQILYRGVAEAIQTIKNNDSKADLIITIVREKFTPEQAEFAGALNRWAAETIETIKTIEKSWHKAWFIKTILNTEFTPEQAMFAESFYQLAAETIGTIENSDDDKVELITDIIRKEFAPEQARFTEALYQWAAEAIGKIKIIEQNYKKALLISTILKKKFTHEQAEFANKLYQWAAGTIETLKTIDEEYFKIDLFKAIFKKTFTPQQAEFSQALHQWATTEIKTIKEDSLEKSNLIETIINKEFTHEQAIFADELYQWAAEAIKTIKHDFQIVSLITTIVNKEFTQEQTALAQALYQWSVEAIGTIKDEYDKISLITTIVNKEFTREQKTLSKALYKWSAQAIKTIKNVKKHPNKTRLIETIRNKKFPPKQRHFAQALQTWAVEAI